MKLTYPACFYPDENDVYTVVIPDLKGAVTEGKTLAGAMGMAVDCACGWILTSIEDGGDIPLPSPINEIKADEYENGFVNLLLLDIDEYAEKHGDKAVSQSCTIPGWLNDAALAEGINFSRTLQDALIAKLSK